MPFQILKNTSIARKLYFTIGIMAVLIIIELFVLSFALNILSSIRGYVNGEALWSKSERDASLHLRLYAYSGLENDYQSFLKYLQVPLGDRQERIALEKPVPDIAMARAGLLQGRNHPEDIDGMIYLLLRFGKVSHLARTIKYWNQAETTLLKFIPLGEKLRGAVISGTLTPTQAKAFMQQIDVVNQEIKPAEDAFSYTLGEGSRWLEKLVQRILITVALTVEITGIIIAISISRSIRKGLNSIIEVANKLAEGDLQKRVKVRSRDEIGRLAAAFNIMADRLQLTLKKHQESENKLRSFFESSTACHILLNVELKVIAFNRFAANFIRQHYKTHLAEGLCITTWVTADIMDDFLNACKRAVQGETIELEVSKKYQDGKTIWWLMTFAGARNEAGDIIGVSYNAADITGRLSQELEIRQQNKILTDIAYVQSHEMRRPVASILGLMNVFETEEWNITKDAVLMLKAAMLELDDQIRKIVTQTES